MEKLSKISLGRGNVWLDIGTILIIVLIGILIYTGFNIKVSSYLTSDVFYHNDSLYLISDEKIHNIEYIYIGEKNLQKVKILAIAKNEYLIDKDSINKSDLNYLIEKKHSTIKIKRDSKKFFEKMLPNHVFKSQKY